MRIGQLDTLLDRRRIVVFVLAVFCGLLLLVGGAGDSVDLQLHGFRDMVRRHPASGRIAIVEIDSRSLRELSHWPLPRRHHAALIDRLRESGAYSIGYDVDFSSRSNSFDDDALSAALARAGGSVILATLLQQATSHGADVVENMPIRPFRDHAFLAAVNIIPEADGQVRYMPTGLEIAGVPRPALAAMVAERDAANGTFYPIDYSVDPATIPRFSFADVIAGRVPAAAIRGKRLMIGMTAVEIGDRFGAPGHGVLPGVVIQALAAETLLAGPPPRVAGGTWALLLAFAAIAAAMRGTRRGPRILAFAVGTAAVLLLPLAGEQFFALSFILAPALGALGAAAIAAGAFHFAARARQAALTDESSGLPNLFALEADLKARELVIVARINGFATIAAGLGREATVSLIQRVADRLRFGRDRPVYRIDEAHLAWIDPADDLEALDDQLDGLSALMRSPIDCGRLVDVDIAFGIAGAETGDSRRQVANASLAAERAARSNRRRDYFTADAASEIDWQLSLLGELDQAMVEGQIWNAYQPKLDIRTGRICGVETLVRWDHPRRGPIGPDDFIPLIEEHDRARDLTLHVLTRALADAALWRAQGRDLHVAVNVSATLLLDTSFVVLLAREIAAAGLAASFVTLEVTESAAMKDASQAIAALESWRRLGLGISIDDYGTGHSSLGYLQTLPATELKIDKSFVATVATDKRNAIMVRSTIAMAHELGMKVVAEGVENEACLVKLAEIDCDTAQGWHVGRPMSATDLIRFIDDAERAAA